MPYKRTALGKFKKVKKFKRTGMKPKKYSIKRSLVGSSRNEHQFRRICTTITTDVSSAEYDFSLEFKFSDITGAAEFSALYDRYMITMVIMKIRIVNNPDATIKLNDALNIYNSSNWYPRLFSCPDYDNSTVETLTQLKERARTRMRVLKPNAYLKYVIKPAVAIQTYRTSLASGYAPKWRQWLDMDQTDVPHYGMKFVMDMSGLDPSDTYPYKLEIERTFYFKCADVR